MTASTDTIRQSSRAERAQEFFQLLPALKRRLQATLPQELTDELAGVTPHQLEALNYLRHLQDMQGASIGATMNELARAQHCALSTATALADRLIRQGLAERRPDPEDRRVVHLTPTARGEELTHRFAEARRGMGIELFSPLSDEELDTLVRLMRTIAAEAPQAEQEPDRG